MLNEINRFVNWQRRRNPAARTWRDYRIDLHQFAAVVNCTAAADVSIRDIDAFVIEQANRGLQPSTINRRLAAITSFYTFLSDEDPAISCPVLPHRHTLRQRQQLPKPVGPAIVDRFFTVIDSTRDRAIFTLMLRCGLRISETAAINLTHLSLDPSPPRLTVCGKGGRERTAYLSPQTETAIRAWLAERPATSDPALFVSYQHRRLSTTAIHKRLMVYRQQADVHLTAHQLRHTFANDLVTADVPVATIQKLLGHRWIATTQTYIAANDRQVQRHFYTAIAALEGWT